MKKRRPKHGRTEQLKDYIARELKQTSSKYFGGNEWLLCYSKEFLCKQVLILFKWMNKVNANTGNKWILQWILNNKYNLESNMMMNLLIGENDGVSSRQTLAGINKIQWKSLEKCGCENDPRTDQSIRPWEEIIDDFYNFRMDVLCGEPQIH
jgi:hypothetical protein